MDFVWDKNGRDNGIFKELVQHVATSSQKFFPSLNNLSVCFRRRGTRVAGRVIRACGRV